MKKVLFVSLLLTGCNSNIETRNILHTPKIPVYLFESCKEVERPDIEGLTDKEVASYIVRLRAMNAKCMNVTKTIKEIHDAHKTRSLQYGS